AVVFDGADADEQFLGYLLVGLCFGYQTQNAPLGRREVIEPGLAFNQSIGTPAPRKQIAGQFRTDKAAAAANSSDATGNLGQGAVFENIPLYACVQRGLE